LGLKPDVVLLYGIGDAQTAVTDKLKELYIPYMYVGEYLEESSEVQAACPWYPPTDLSAFPCESAEQCASSAESLLLGFNSKRNREKAYNCSPVSKVTKDAPPFLIIHGNCDRTVPYVQSKTLYNLLEAQGCDVTLLTLDGADHADLQFFQDETWNWIIDFFNRKLK
jgi:acetyl esterase/lipase